MSKFAIQSPIIHTPSFKEYQIGGGELQAKLEALGLKLPIGMLDSTYYFTDADGWAKVLADLTFKSDLYKAERFDCEDYAMKACVTCWERYGLNAFGLVLGMTPAGYHGFNIFFDGEGFSLLEPNAGFGYGGMFPIGEHGYVPSMIVI